MTHLGPTHLAAAYAEAKQRWDAIRYRKHQPGATAVLPPSTRAEIAHAVSELRPPIGFTSQRGEKFRKLCAAGARKPTALGFIQIRDGGVPTLATEVFGMSLNNSGSINRWLSNLEDADVITRFYGRGGRRHPPLIAIQVPALTEALLWMAEHRRFWLDGVPTKRGRRSGGSTDLDGVAPTPEQLLTLLELSVRLGPPFMPPTVETEPEARRVITSLVCFLDPIGTAQWCGMDLPFTHAPPRFVAGKAIDLSGHSMRLKHPAPHTARSTGARLVFSCRGSQKR